MRTIFPGRATAAIAQRAVDAGADATPAIAIIQHDAAQRIGASEANFPETTAWRAACVPMALKPMKNRCAAEAILQFRKEGSLSAIHPLIDRCDAAPLALATPVAVFDLDRITGDLTVRAAEGHEGYPAFSGGTEQSEALPPLATVTQKMVLDQPDTVFEFSPEKEA
ncbi:DNA/RNA-binding domain of Phe-tRNA-synthetase-like protein [Sagittula marina]|uniref:DNA/RNA-binding domain of Phe-tRNA-synthetase-like protein n=2 Tax=Sagittula marina TaxID=943940 RepID=A0A7W6DNG6_9RHOB|nr:DNA/RNA-binding domain of Phe-tRNA-synthetase-like protein [Sagittula marina]